MEIPLLKKFCRTVVISFKFIVRILKLTIKKHKRLKLRNSSEIYLINWNKIWIHTNKEI
jgi:hypothetical protein